MGASTVAGNAMYHGKLTNECGLTNNHNYSILDSFTMNDLTNGGTVDMIMLRDTTGRTAYEGPWNYQDDFWDTP